MAPMNQKQMIQNKMIKLGQWFINDNRQATIA